MHANARTTPRSRADIVRLVLKEGQTVRKWVERYRHEGVGGLQERSSRPAHSPKRILPDQREQALRWRRQGLVYAEIAQRTGLSGQRHSIPSSDDTHKPTQRVGEGRGVQGERA
jgi:hypothetical protein